MGDLPEGAIGNVLADSGLADAKYGLLAKADFVDCLEEFIGGMDSVFNCLQVFGASVFFQYSAAGAWIVEALECAINAVGTDV